MPITAPEKRGGKRYFMEETAPAIEQIKKEIGKRIVGQDYMIDGMLIGLLAGGHILIEGVPGLAKTLAIKSLAETLKMDFHRIQFTPDLLPADLIGTLAYKYQTGEFFVRKGPLFSHVVLADEINRAPAKVQSALLESMEEKQVTIGDTSYKLPEPYFVMATQNPIEHEGTYPLPEAQLDRFLMKLNITYPTAEEEMEILAREDRGKEDALHTAIEQVMNPETVLALRGEIKKVTIDEKINRYIVSIVASTREPSPYLEFGASPRASLALHRCAKVRAFLRKRTYILPEDVKDVVHDVLRHRIILSYEAESEELAPDDIISALLDKLPVP